MPALSPLPHDRPGRPPPRNRNRRTERGSAAVEVAVLLPVVMLLLMVVVQAGIYFHTRAVATTAARKAVTAARVEDGTGPDGQQAAEQFLDQNGAALHSRQVTVTRSATTATASVSGEVASVLFGVPFSVTVTVDAPVEQVTP